MKEDYHFEFGVEEINNFVEDGYRVDFIYAWTDGKYSPKREDIGHLSFDGDKNRIETSNIDVEKFLERYTILTL